MIAALGAHSANNPTVVVVVASFANATSEEWNAPHAQTDIAQWLAEMTVPTPNSQLWHCPNSL